jgi:co-chaperonin GroES (HSP10)
MKIKGQIKPLRDTVFVTDMEFGNQSTASGIFIPSDNGKSQGVHPRWGKVWAIGPEQKDVVVGQWALIEHGRWTRSIKVSQEDTADINIHMVDANAIMVIADERPSDILRSET